MCSFFFFFFFNDTATTEIYTPKSYIPSPFRGLGTHTPKHVGLNHECLPPPRSRNPRSPPRPLSRRDLVDPRRHGAPALPPCAASSQRHLRQSRRPAPMADHR